jgi:hypothetical protein
MQVHLTNTGADPCDVAVEVPAAQREWSWVHPESCGIGPGEESVVAVFFKPKCGPTPPAGSHSVEVVARASGDPSASTTGHGTVDVGPWVDAAGTLDPMVAHDLMGHDFTFNLENRGNVPMRARLSTDDPSGVLDVDVRPAEVSAGPGETATATVGVHARKKLKKGEQRYRVCVVAKVEDGSELRIEGAFYQQGVKGLK